MRQFYAHYEQWEDYQNGMYDISRKQNEVELISMAIYLLCDSSLFYKTCNDVVLNWKISSMVNLTNKSCNRKAWLGQSACCYKYGVPEVLTRIAWSKLTDMQRFEANKVAQKIINHFELNYERKNISLYIGMGKQMLS